MESVRWLKRLAGARSDPFMYGASIASCVQHIEYGALIVSFMEAVNADARRTATCRLVNAATSAVNPRRDSCKGLTGWTGRGDSFFLAASAFVLDSWTRTDLPPIGKILSVIDRRVKATGKCLGHLSSSSCSRTHQGTVDIVVRDNEWTSLGGERA